MYPLQQSLLPERYQPIECHVIRDVANNMSRTIPNIGWVDWSEVLQRVN